MNAPIRKIIHCDCDCFYASVEMRDDPSLRGRPLAVGGRADQRGVIATCNYEARRYGIHSAMATGQAMKLCPELRLIPPNMEKYRIASTQIMDIYRDYTELVEPLSLDEAYLDVTASKHCKGSATLIAQEIRQRIFETVGITASAGVAPSKFVAKIASDWNKPDGLFLVRPDEVDAFVAALPVKKLHGVGKVTAAKMNGLGVQTCADLRSWSMAKLQEHFGSFGARLHDLCRGIDFREVNPVRERKSISTEETYTPDVPDLPACLALLPELMEQLQGRIRRNNAEKFINKLFVKLKFNDFQQTTVECVGYAPNLAIYTHLMETGWLRASRPVRLLGVGVRLADTEQVEQLSLFDERATH
ncbi:DNA polymerase IV [Massilia sp. WF1]|uniref:DNA polymerase IV n=1 Tax=unclassified Massilia TaxID=2609279 RepID=UPI00064A024A|nr:MULTISPECIES: DNA polymerase IV [unclassified Massilia]ALK94947.1 DNA polymerase IV [Massilia sp. WG5]KLU38366.1 DNA polymerase IV [Massilia sp. WF1]